jgi:hypothetical protein
MERELEKRLRELIDRQDIHDVLLRYCRACDRIDEELLRTVFHEDAYIDYGVFSGTAREFLAWIIDNIRDNYTHGSHNICNEYVAIDGDVAYVELNIIIHNGVPDDKGQIIYTLLGGRYLDRFERRQGEWRIANRKFLFDWSEGKPAEAQLDSGMNDNLGIGKRSREDASYKHLPPRIKSVLDWS